MIWQMFSLTSHYSLSFSLPFPRLLLLSLSLLALICLFYVAFLTLDFSPFSDSQQRTLLCPIIMGIFSLLTAIRDELELGYHSSSYLFDLSINLCLNTWQVLRTKISENINYLQNLLSAFYYYFIYDFIIPIIFINITFPWKVPDSKGNVNYVIFHARKIWKTC